MDLNGRRESTNVEDRRGKVVKGTGIGIGGLAIIALLTWLLGGNPQQAIQQVQSMQGSEEVTDGSYQPTEEEQQFVTLTKQVLAGTEDVWTSEFQKIGKTYTAPKLVLFTKATTSGCGTAQSSTGPFYCSQDQCIYLDVSFFDDMKSKYGGGGDFAYAYVVAHEVGHHVQYLLGTLDKVHSQMSQSDEKTAHQLSVRLELQADYYAGVWAYHDNQMYNSLEAGDVEKGVATAQAIGDDRLETEAQGYAVPDSFTHGTSAQRVKWLKKGIQNGTIQGGDTFSCSYSTL